MSVKTLKHTVFFQVGINARNNATLLCVKTAFGTLLGLVLLAGSLGSANAQPTRSGSHLESNSVPSYVLQLTSPDEIERIRQLLLDGRDSDALLAANAYVEEIEKTTLVHETQRRYYAYNALCTVYSSLKLTDEAIEACSKAIALEPDKWSAVNNRGTAKLMAGQLVEAMADYEAALTKAPEGNESIELTIQHNMNLVRDQQSRVRN